MTQTEVDVIVVGFGPVGAALAALLGRRGVRVLVLERDEDVFPLPRAAHIDHQSLRLLQNLGCLEELMARMLPNPGVDFLTADHRVLMRIPGNQPSVSGLPASMYFHQPPFDRTIRAVAAAEPAVEVRLGTRMLAIEARDDHVVVFTRSLAGRAERVTGRWLVGCDGAWSPVREFMEIGLGSLNFDEKWVVVDLRLLREIPTLPNHAVTVCDPARPLFAIPIPDGRFRFELQMRLNEDPEEIQKPRNVLALLRDWVPAGAVEVERAAVYTFHGLLTRQWRMGRVLLAGDAAHQMPPFLGQGMNSGLRDAWNLAWKLGLVVGRNAPETLLDTYQTERGPHVRQIIQAAIRYGAIICENDPARAAARDRDWLRTDVPPETRLPFSLPNLEAGPLVLEGGGDLFVQPPANSMGTRLDDLIGDGFLVLGRDAAAIGASGEWWKGLARVTTLGALDEDWADAAGRWMDRRDAAVVVVRPDRYVLAAGDDLAKITERVAGMLGAHPEPSPMSLVG